MHVTKDTLADSLLNNETDWLNILVGFDDASLIQNLDKKIERAIKTKIL